MYVCKLNARLTGQIMKQKRYEQVAEKIINLIQNDVLKEGDKIPSLRQLSQELSFSVTTIKEAYWKLEDKNYIVAVPQSGFYVKKQSQLAMEPEETIKSQILDPQIVSFCQVYAAFQEKDGSHSKVNLGIAGLDPDYWPREKISRFLSEAVKHSEHDIFNYIFSPGYLPLRQQIARQGISAGLNLSPDDIIITNGSQEAQFLSLMVLCKPGDTIVLESPIYFNLLQLIKQLDLKIIEIPSSDSDGISLETLEYVLENHPVKVMYSISNYNNPMGFSMPSWKKKKMVRLLSRYHVPLIEDDVYGDITFKERPDTCKSHDKSGRVLYCSSFSKSIAPGFRIGWIAPGRAYEQIIRMKSLMNISVASINQIAVARFLKEGGYSRHVKSLKKHLKANIRKIRKAVLKEFPDGTRVTDPDGGFLLWIELPNGVDTSMVFEQALTKNILIAPGTMFSMKGKYIHCMRMNAGIWNPQIKQAIARVGSLCCEQSNRKRDYKKTSTHIQSI